MCPLLGCDQHHLLLEEMICRLWELGCLRVDGIWDSLASTVLMVELVLRHQSSQSWEFQVQLVEIGGPDVGGRQTEQGEELLWE